MRDTRLALAGLAVILGLMAATEALAPEVRAAQAPSASAGASFEVASVKPNKSGDNRIMLGMQPGGRFTATNVPLRLLIRNAYRVQDTQIIGGPGWMATDRFDIQAKADSDPEPDELNLMTQHLLADRFKLTLHHETRELPTYALVVDRADRKLGPKLKASAIDCQAAGRGSGGRPPAPPAPGEPLSCGMRIAPGALNGGGMPLSQLATMLSQFVGRIVQDKSDLPGGYDFDLAWTPDQPSAGGPAGPGGPGAAAGDANGPSLFTALQEQLGLKLESTRGSVDVLVIDTVNQPTPD